MVQHYVVAIGSKSLPKVSAVIRAVGRYPELWDGRSSIEFVLMPARPDAGAGIPDQPATIDEIFQGARARAKDAYEQAKCDRGVCAFGIGLEAGVFPVDPSVSGYMDVSIAAIYDGDRYSYGGSPLFEYPKPALRRLLQGEEAGALCDLFGTGGKGR